MNATLRHRGPDDGHVWIEEQCGIALGHRRLSIVDLSEEGSQPMESACERYVITFNGEIYNFKELRRELENHANAPAFRGHSDTEVMLACISAWGLESALQKFVGMFAFALWDRRESALYLVRDRMGVKPLYYAWCGNTVIFASELKALRMYPGFNSAIDRDALCLYFRFQYIPAPRAIYQDCLKLPQGHVLKITSDMLKAGGVKPESRPYWSSRDIWSQPLFDLDQIPEIELIDNLEKLLKEAIQLRMISDVPLGAFLSGGIDSSIVVSLMQGMSDRPVQTFTIGYKEQAYDESEFASKIAHHLGTDHTLYPVSEQDALNVIPLIPDIWDEPFADVSQIPTYLVSRLARQEVTVSLSGDGGDELFAGYDRYRRTQLIWAKLQRLPLSVRKSLAVLLHAFPEQVLDILAAPFGPVMKRRGLLGAQGKMGLKLHRLADTLSRDEFSLLYKMMVSYEHEPDRLVINGHEPSTLFDSDCSGIRDELQAMLYWDSNTYLADDILTKVDRASMSTGLEARTPLLDHRVVEFAARIPASLKIRNGGGKWILRQVLNRYVPASMFDRPKMGLGVPIDSWLGGALRDWSEALLDTGRLKSEGYLDVKRVRHMWGRYLAGEKGWQYNLWSVLMFQSWLESHEE